MLIQEQVRLIAIMLGRLQMTVQECIDAFLDISHEVFNERRNRFFIKRKSSPRRRKVEVDALERAVKKILGQREVAEDTLLCESPNPRCKVYVDIQCFFFFCSGLWI